jgi:hypothetical protein
MFEKGIRSGPRMSFRTDRRQTSNLSTLPGSTDAAFAVKTERLPPTGFPPLRHGAEALLTAHSIRIGDRTGIEVASPATSKLERTSDD